MEMRSFHCILTLMETRSFHHFSQVDTGIMMVEASTEAGIMAVEASMEAEMMVAKELRTWCARRR